MHVWESENAVQRLWLGCVAAGIAALVVGLVLLAVPSRPGLASQGPRWAANSPCPIAGTPPAGGGSDTAGGTSSPVPDAKSGTPVARSGLTVTLFPASTKARPNDLTVVVLDEECAPVTGAAVAIRTQSLAMDHGVRTSKARPVEPGRYVADRIPMGMAGDWQVTVSIARPGEGEVIFVFVVTLQGPS